MLDTLPDEGDGHDIGVARTSDISIQPSTRQARNVHSPSDSEGRPEGHLHAIQAETIRRSIIPELGPEPELEPDIYAGPRPKTPERSEARSLRSINSVPEPDVRPEGDADWSGWWDASSPLSIAVRRRQFLHPESGRDLTEEQQLRRQPEPHRVASLNALDSCIYAPKPRKNSSLHTLDSLEIMGQHCADYHLDEPSFEEKRRKDSDVVKNLIIPRTPLQRVKAKEAEARAKAGQIPPRTPSPVQNIQSSQASRSFIFPRVSEEDPRRLLSNKNLVVQRCLFGFLILAVNVGCLVGAFVSDRHIWVLVIVLLAKTKDVLSTLIQIFWSIFRFIVPKEEIPDRSKKWILTCVTAYAETEEQIMRTINSVIDSKPARHKIAMVVILDGKPQPILKYFSQVVQTIRRPYQTWRYAHNEITIYTGFIRDVPVMLFEKIENVGKKDSLILCHDLFNFMRANAPEPTKGLRLEIWTRLLPKLIPVDLPERFDFLFFTDADSMIYPEALSHLCEALIKEPASIAACGLVLVELTKSNTWSLWYLYQQFQYTYGQFIRRQTEGIWGRVTCLPGCITMVKNRHEMAGAIRLYASHVSERLVLNHQIQYLGTDRRITWCMLEQSKKIKTLFVPEAISQTIAPESFIHYMSQRRRWGSNAYFNDVCYVFGKKSWTITRLWGLIDLLRQSLVYYRLANTVLFLYGLSRYFAITRLVPYIVVTQTPTLWFFVVVLTKEPILCRMVHKLLLGWLLNKMVSPFFSILIFSRVTLNLGSAVWGTTGVSTHAGNVLDILRTLTPKRSWTPNRITSLVRDTLQERNRKTKTGLKLGIPPEKFSPRMTERTIAEKRGPVSYQSSFMPATPRQTHMATAPAESTSIMRRTKVVKMEELS